MRYNKHIQTFEQQQDNLNISDDVVSDYTKQDVINAIMSFAKLF